MESSTHELSAEVHTYHGRTIEELIPKIQEELGEDAIVVRRREGLTGGLAGFFQRPFVELDATAGGPRLDVYDEEIAAPVRRAVTDYPAQARQLPSEPIGPDYLEPGYAEPGYAGPGHAGPGHVGPDYPQPGQTELSIEQQATRTPFYAREPLRLSRDGRYVTEDLAALARASMPRREAQSSLESASLAQHGLRSVELPEPFAQMLEQAASAGLLHDARTGSRENVDTGTRDSALAQRGAAERTRAQAKIQNGLLALGVGEAFADELLEAAAVHVRPLSPRASLGQTVRLALAQRIPVAPPLPIQGGAIVLVGPGGAGKTSCCAALLGAYRRSSSRPANCATLLRSSDKGELQMLLSPQIRKPLLVDTARAERALRKARDEGLLVIDTPPLSPGDRASIRKLGSILDRLKPERVVIVLPATLGPIATTQLLEALRPLGANALALTHNDETDQIGVAVEAACTFGLAPEYALKRRRPGGWTIGRVDPAGLAATLVP